ncbi:MAG TPA: MvdD family ATP-grasp ribosomal peptide maturase, partial [Myxococcota bacterium]|nr:MvdD family ATP-grasp ribosomal peptide maturase [Myxococcota bacterium]
AAAVDPRGSVAGEVDWRQDQSLVGAFVPWALDPKVEASLLKLMDRMGLNFGTCDIIVTPEGRHVFLEINTVSFFDFIEECTGMPISRAVADLLTGKEPSRLKA